jgi:hypothetical protein
VESRPIRRGPAKTWGGPTPAEPFWKRLWRNYLIALSAFILIFAGGAVATTGACRGGAYGG